MRSKVLCGLFGTIVLAITTSAQAQTTFENLTSDVGRGFGNSWNRYAWAMGELNGQVYVGTWSTQMDYPLLANKALDGSLLSLLGGLILGGNPLEAIDVLASDGAEIWRHDGGQRWTRVYKAAPTTTGFRKAVTHNGKLYMGTLNVLQGTRILRSDDGVHWQDLAGGPLANPDNISIRSMLSCDGELLVGTENNATGGELWAYDDVADAWTHVETFVNDSSVAELALWDGRIAVGTWDFTDSYNFYIQQSGGDWLLATPVIPGGEELSNVGVMKLIIFQGRIYLGTANYSDGFTLLRTATPDDDGSWEVISTDGFGNPDNAYVWAMVEWDGKLMLGTFNSGVQYGDSLFAVLDGFGELYSSENGIDWEFVPGAYANVFNYGIRNMLVTQNGDLLLGMASNFLLPDASSSLYTSQYLDLYGNPWLAWTAQTAINAFLAMATDQDPSQPWIGCEVYRAVKPQPAATPSWQPFPLFPFRLR